MRIFVALTLCLVVTSCNAGLFDSLSSAFSHIGDAFSTALTQVGSQAKQLGEQLLQTTVEQGKQIAGQTLQSLALGTMNALQTDPRPSRDLHDILQQFQPALDGIHQSIDQHAHQLNGVFHTAIDKLVEVGGKLMELSPEEISAEVDKIVAAHHTIADHLSAELQHALVAHHKRSGLSDALSSVASAIANFVLPRTDALKGIVSGTGDVIKQTAATLGQSVAESLSQLEGKLHGHAQALSSSTHAIQQQGANALIALKDAVTGILAQTITNVQPHINNILQTGVSALGVAANHLTTSLGTALGSAIASAVNGAINNIGA